MKALWTSLLLLDITADVLAQPVRLPPPAAVRFFSVDYKTTLVWTPRSNSSSTKHYVQWKIYGEPRWRDVVHCQGIKETKCDLSNVTSDITEWYYARVHSTAAAAAAESAWTTSSRFSPRWNTKISPPLLRVNSTVKGILVRVKPPRALVRKNHSDLYYKIYLTTENGHEELELNCCFHKRLITSIRPRTRYCVQAQTVLPLQARSSARSEATCVTSK